LMVEPAIAGRLFMRLTPFSSWRFLLKALDGLGSPCAS
jgi:hypothetical protein